MGKKSIDVYGILLCLAVMYILFGYFFKFTGLSNGNGFTPNSIIETALNDKGGIRGNNDLTMDSNCCVSIDSGFSNDPVPLSDRAPGFSIITPYNNPCA